MDRRPTTPTNGPTTRRPEAGKRLRVRSLRAPARGKSRKRSQISAARPCIAQPRRARRARCARLCACLCSVKCFHSLLWCNMLSPDRARSGRTGGTSDKMDDVENLGNLEPGGRPPSSEAVPARSGPIRPVRPVPAPLKAPCRVRSGLGAYLPKTDNESVNTIHLRMQTILKLNNKGGHESSMNVSNRARTLGAGRGPSRCRHGPLHSQCKPSATTLPHQPTWTNPFAPPMVLKNRTSKELAWNGGLTRVRLDLR